MCLKLNSAPATGAASNREKGGIGLIMELNPKGITVKLKNLWRRVKSALITVGALDFKRRKPMAVTARRKSVVADSANPR